MPSSEGFKLFSKEHSDFTDKRGSWEALSDDAKNVSSISFI